MTASIPQKTQGHFSLKKNDKKKTSPKKKLTLINKNEEVVIKLESPTSISMKNCFLIKNEHPSFEKCYQQIKKRSLEKSQVDNEEQKVTKQSGKRPPARDGHSGVVINGQFFVFGGDRHHMPFNDFFMLDIAREFADKQYMF
jgi:hypothetical protein